jgi:hypothetical protein
VDRTLLILLAEAWKTGDRADVLALVDLIKEAPPEEVVETFLAFRSGTVGAAALPDVFTGIAEALNRAGVRLSPSEDPGQGRR